MTLIVLAAGIAVSLLVWRLTGGRVALVLLPLILIGLPFLGRGRRD